MKNVSTWSYYLPAAMVGLLCLVIAAPAAAHPGSLWGVDLPSVIALRDQARVVGHELSNGEDEERAPGLQRLRTIVIDPGHGGDNSGATGVAGIAEKFLTLELAYELRERLQERYPDLRVVLTRYWDTSLDFADRVHLANMASGDLFLSLHYNAAVHDRAVGFETYFLRPEEVTPGQEEVQGQPVASVDGSVTGIDRPIDGLPPFGQYGDSVMLIEQDLLRAHQHMLSGLLAESVQESFRQHLDAPDRGVKQANFAVLRGAHMPAVVVEAGFLTHPEEGMEVTTSEHRTLVATALLDAVADFDTQLASAFDDEEDVAEVEEFEHIAEEETEPEEVLEAIPVS